MRNFKLNLTIFGALMLAIGLLMADSTWAQGKGGGKGGGSEPPPPPPSPLQYKLKLSGPTGDLNGAITGAVNTHGVYVTSQINPTTGFQEGLLFDSCGYFGSDSGTYTLSQLVVNPLPVEWERSAFWAVNDQNHIVGRFARTGSAATRVFALDLSGGIPGTWKYLDPADESAGPRIVHTVVDINESGLVLMDCATPLDGTVAGEWQNLYNRRMYLVDVVDGTSHLITCPTTAGTANAEHGEAMALNDNGQVAWIQTAPNQENLSYANRIRRAYILDYQLTEDTFAFEPLDVKELGDGLLLQARQLSDWGTCAGSVRVTIAARPRPINTTRAARTFFSPGLAMYVTDVFGADYTYAASINGEGDILVYPNPGGSSSLRGSLYVGAEVPLPGGLSLGPALDLRNLIQVDTVDESFWNYADISAAMFRLSHRDGTGFGKVAGRVYHNVRREWRLVVLEPNVTMP
jgi:hypothetical protein